MGPDLAVLVATRLPDSIRDVMISGGEPTLWPHLDLLAGALLDRGIRVSLQTNGTHPEVVAKMLDLGVTHYNVSLDGPPEVHDRIRGDGVFDKAVECIRMVRILKRSVVTTTVLSSYNLDHASSLIGQICRRRARPQVMLFELERRFDTACIASSSALVGIDPGQMGVRASESAAPPYSVEDLRKAVDSTLAKAWTYRQKIVFLPSCLDMDLPILHSRQNRLRSLTCSHKRVLRVDPTGQVVPCFTFRTPVGDLGSQSVEEIVMNPAWVRFWSALDRGNLTPACETCFRALPIPCESST